MTGYFPSVIGLYCTTVIASIGFHYYETCNQSLAMQWLEKQAPVMLGRIYGVASMAQVGTLVTIFVVVLLLTEGLDPMSVITGDGFSGARRSIPGCFWLAV